MAEIRLNKWLAGALGVSRREADEMIAGGRVAISWATSEGKVPAGLGTRIEKLDLSEDKASSPRANSCKHGSSLGSSLYKVFVDNTEVKPLAKFTYLAFNKPVGYVSSRRAQGVAPTLYELLPEEYRSLKTVGRLDKDSSGLLLLTDDGDFAHQMMHPSFAKTKLYEVELDTALQPMHQQMIADFGLRLKDGVSKMGLTKIGEGRKRWEVTLGEGRNRQIRRTFGALGYAVVGLRRVRFGGYELGGLKTGAWQEISYRPA